MDRQMTGGTLTIDDDWLVIGADFDAENPFIVIGSNSSQLEEIRVPVPKSLAYFLSTHWCGSNKMHETIVKNTKYKIRNTISDALGM